ncbi:MAG TPA: tetratricopeptide repeat protein, partial [Polyangia bacterium]|nr:tetratricopeptide repeat protein [Polyangia bacterium]
DAGPEALIEQGLSLRRAGKPEEALELFKRAHAMAPSARTFGQMGLVETSLQRWVDGETHLSMSLSNPDDAWVHKNRAFLDEALGVCRQHVGELLVSGPAGVEVFVGGKSVGTLPTVPALLLPEGTTTVTASGAAFKPLTQTVVVWPNARTKLALAMTPLSPPPPAVPPPTADVPAPTATAAPSISISTPPPPAPRERGGEHWHRWLGVSLATAGAAAAAWGAVWVAIDGDRTGSSRYETKTPGWILVGAGAAAIAGGATIFFTGRPDEPTVAMGLAPGSFLIRARF